MNIFEEYAAFNFRVESEVIWNLKLLLQLNALKYFRAIIHSHMTDWEKFILGKWYVPLKKWKQATDYSGS